MVVEKEVGGEAGLPDTKLSCLGSRYSRELADELPSLLPSCLTPCTLGPATSATCPTSSTPPHRIWATDRDREGHFSSITLQSKYKAFGAPQPPFRWLHSSTLSEIAHILGFSAFGRGVLFIEMHCIMHSEGPYIASRGRVDLRRRGSKVLLMVL